MGAFAGLASNFIGGSSWSIGLNVGRSVVLGVGTQITRVILENNQIKGKIIITPKAASQKDIKSAIDYVIESGALSEIFDKITLGLLGNTDLVFDITSGGNEAGHSGIYGFNEELGDFTKPLSEFAQLGYLEESDLSQNMPLQLKIQIGVGNSVGYNVETFIHEAVLHITSMVSLIKYLRGSNSSTNILKDWTDKTKDGGSANDKRQHSEFLNPKNGLRKVFNKIVDKLKKFIKNTKHQKELKEAVADDLNIQRGLKNN